jgi:hypothetical protein
MISCLIFTYVCLRITLEAIRAGVDLAQDFFDLVERAVKSLYWYEQVSLTQSQREYIHEQIRYVRSLRGLNVKDREALDQAITELKRREKEAETTYR